MATSKQFISEFLDKTAGLPVRLRPMMGEYLFYYRDKLLGDICDDKLLLKITPSSLRMLPDAEKLLPYVGATKPMIYLENYADFKLFEVLCEAMYIELSDKNRRK